MCSAELLQSDWRRGRPHLHVGWVWCHPTSLQHRWPGSLQLGKTSLDCSLYERYDIPSLLCSNIVTRVSDAFPSVYIYISIYVFHSIDYSSFRVLYSFCTRVGLLMVQPTDTGSTVLRIYIITLNKVLLEKSPPVNGNILLRFNKLRQTNIFKANCWR